MNVEIKELIAWGGTLVAIVAQFFHLKNRITLLEARQRDLRENLRDRLDRMEHTLDSIDRKLDKKADK